MRIDIQVKAFIVFLENILELELTAQGIYTRIEDFYTASEPLNNFFLFEKQ